MRHQIRRKQRFQQALPFIAVLAAMFQVAGCGSAPGVRPASDLLTPAALPASAVINQLPLAPPDAARGRAIYASKCLACHGDGGQGDGLQAAKIRTQGGQVAKLVGSVLSQGATPADWFDVVSNGRMDKLMPQFAQTLTPQERWDVLSYIWALDAAKPSTPAPQRTYAEACQSCHGAAGKGHAQDFSASAPVSFAESAWLVRNSLFDIASAMISGTVHARVTLDEPQRLALAATVRTFGYRYVDPDALARAEVAGDGKLSLYAVNGTPGGGAVTGLPVALHAYSSNGEVFSRTATIDRNGIAAFAALPRDPTLFYQADVLYNGARFFAPPTQFTETLQLSATLPLFEVTNDPSVIAIAEYHYFVQDVGEGFISVVEFYAFENMSDRAYINRMSSEAALRSLQISVPPDATDITFDGPGLDARFFQDGQLIYDSDAVPPGTQATTIAMLYRLPYHGSREITREMAYPVKNWDVLLPDNELRISNLRDNGLQAFHTGSIRTYVPEKTELAKGETLSIKLLGQPHTLQVPGDDRGTLLVGVAIVLAAALAAVILLVRLRRARAVERDLSAEQDTLLQQIVELDNYHAGGEIDADDYRRTRASLKESLREIWQ